MIFLKFLFILTKTSFNRQRYDNYFDKTYFYEDLENRNLKYVKADHLLVIVIIRLLKQLTILKKEIKI